MSRHGKLAPLEVVFLAGGPLGCPIERGVGRPLWALPLGREGSLLEIWRGRVVRALAASNLFQDVNWRIVISAEYATRLGGQLDDVGVVFDPRSHRGTAGLVRDVCFGQTANESCVLLVELSASPVVCLEALFSGWTAVNGSPLVCLVGESYLRRYCGVSMFSRAVLSLVPDVGFFDFKEQLLPAVRGSRGVIDAVGIAQRARRVRTRQEWIDAVQAWRRYADQEIGVTAPLNSQGWRNDESNVISQTASISRAATVVSSIVMEEAVVEPGAMVARSVIGPGMRVSAGTRVIDAILADPAAGEAAIRRSGASGTVSVASE